MIFQIEEDNQIVKLNPAKCNVVQIKKQICNKWEREQLYFFKIMKLKYKGEILDDNQYFPKFKPYESDIVLCFIDETIDFSDIIVLEVSGNDRIPQLLQIGKHETVDKLKKDISLLLKCTDFGIFTKKKESNKDGENLEELKDESSISEYNLEDGTRIKIINRKECKLNVQSIFKKCNLETSNVHNTDRILSIIKEVAKEHDTEANNFVIYMKDKLLEKDKFIFEYNIDDKSEIKYCFWMRFRGIIIKGDPIDTAYLSVLYRARNTNIDNDILLRRYTLKHNSDHLVDIQNFLQDLIKYEITQYYPRFVKLSGIHKDDNFVYIEVENLSGTLTMLLGPEKKIEEREIAKWIKQIIECLQIFDHHKFYYSNLTPYGILYDDNRDLKLYSFNLTKHVTKDIFETVSKENNLSKVYVAPEIRDDQSRVKDEKPSVWSLGIILIQIVTGECPTEINGTVTYKLRERTSKDLKELIESCVERSPEKRPSLDQLLKYNFLK